MYIYQVLCLVQSSFPQGFVENPVKSCGKLWKSGFGCEEWTSLKKVSFVAKKVKIIHRKPVDNSVFSVENPVFFCGIIVEKCVTLRRIKY